MSQSIREARPHEINDRPAALRIDDRVAYQQQMQGHTGQQTPKRDLADELVDDFGDFV